MDFTTQSITFRGQKPIGQDGEAETAEMLTLTTGPERVPGPAVTDFTEAINQIITINHEQKQRLGDILKRHQTIFSSRPGIIKEYEHKLQITDTTPFCQKGWPIPIAHRQAVDEEINKMLGDGVIEPSTSPYINPLVTIVKKDGTVRVCLDARKINSVTVPDHEGSLPINEMLSS